MPMDHDNVIGMAKSYVAAWNCGSPHVAAESHARQTTAE